MKNGIIADEMSGSDKPDLQVLSKAVNAINGLLYKDGLIEKIADAIGNDPEKAASTLGDYCVTFIDEIKTKAEMNDSTLMIIAVYIISDIARTLKKAGMFSDTKQLVLEGIQSAVMKYIERNPDSVSAETIDAASQQQVGDEDIMKAKSLMGGMA